MFSKYRTDGGKITRRMRLAYICGEREEFIFTAGVAEALIQANASPQQYAHTLREPDEISDRESDDQARGSAPLHRAHAAHAIADNG